MPLPARHGIRHPVPQLPDTDEVKQPPGFRLGVPASLGPEHDLEVLAGRELGDEVVFLKNQTHLAQPKVRAFPLRQPDDLAPHHLDGTGLRHLEPADHRQQGGFPGAAGPVETDQFPGRHLQIHPVERPHGTRWGGVAELHPNDPHGNLHHQPHPSRNLDVRQGLPTALENTPPHPR